LQFIDLRVQAVTDDGVVEDTFRVDLPTGVISNHMADRRAGVQIGFFSDRAPPRIERQCGGGKRAGQGSGQLDRPADYRPDIVRTAHDGYFRPL